jgi:hypothetical protein
MSAEFKRRLMEQNRKSALGLGCLFGYGT